VQDLDSLICVHDDGDEDTQNHIDEETDKEVEVHSAIPPHPAVHITHCLKCCKDVITVDQTEQTLGRCRQRAELHRNAHRPSHHQPVTGTPPTYKITDNELLQQETVRQLKHICYHAQ